MEASLEKCYYETLGVSQTATNAELKKVYRKLALYWHPDKNLDNEEEATKEFRLVQDAYTVLSDPQERAFYDNHRDVLLQGVDATDEIGIIPYCHAGCYKGFGDDPKGFFGVYNALFERLADEDLRDYDEEIEIPSFGKSTDGFADFVQPFYNFWDNFLTSKSYVWVEKYDTRNEPRKIRRLMEAENKKLRSGAKKERNKDIRVLVAFVKKRDPRIAKHVAQQEKLKLEKQEILQEKKLKQLKERSKMFQQAGAPGWSELTSDLEKDFEAIELLYPENDTNDTDNTKDTDPIDNLYCLACEKYFNSEKTFAAHERSKKHQQALKLLAEAFNELDSDDEVLKEPESISSNEEYELNEISNSKKLSKREKKKKKKLAKLVNDLEVESDEENSDLKSEQISTQVNVDVEADEKYEELDTKDQDIIVDNLETSIPPVVECESNGIADELKSVKMEKKTQNNIPRDEWPQCDHCTRAFPSRNKLFAHIKSTGHASFKSDNPQSQTKAKPSKKGKKRT